MPNSGPFRLIVLLCLGLSSSGAALAFGALGHRLIADQAQSRLTAPALAEAQRLLGRRSAHLLADISTWPDEIRDQPEYQRTAPWHYINFAPGDCNYKHAKACFYGQCLVDALQSQLQQLADRTLPDASRAEALKFVVHLYGDLHQPLHLGYAADKGGNTFQINFPAKQARPEPGDDADTQQLKRWWARQTKGYNLHWLWDSILIESAGLDQSQYLARLETLKPDPAAVARTEVVELAEAGCRLAQAPSLYPPSHRLQRAYIEQHRPLLEQQLRLAGLRLAQVLNRALGK